MSFSQTQTDPACQAAPSGTRPRPGNGHRPAGPGVASHVACPLAFGCLSRADHAPRAHPGAARVPSHTLTHGALGRQRANPGFQVEETLLGAGVLNTYLEISDLEHPFTWLCLGESSVLGPTRLGSRHLCGTCLD